MESSGYRKLRLRVGGSLVFMAIQAGRPTRPAAIAAWLRLRLRLRLPMQFPMIASGIRLAKGEA